MARGVLVQEVAKVLSAKGFKAEPTQVEELLAAMQAKRAEEIGEGGRVDKGQLKNVAGGYCAFWQSEQGSGDTCSKNFKDPGYKNVEHCFAAD